MVSVKLSGGLGNQLFQLAAAIGYAHQHTIPLHIPGSTKDPAKWPLYRMPGVDYDRFDQKPFGHWYIQPEYHFSEIPFFQNIVLDGLFQSEKYFSHSKAVIHTLFALPVEPQLQTRVSIHVRRGDYLNLPDTHPTVTMEYLREAIYHMNSLGHWRFAFFSDDIAWCKEKFNQRDSFRFSRFDFINPGDAISDLGKMASCKHHITANSSYSWWGAYLSQNPEKIVITPSPWFGPDGPPDTYDLRPDGWIQM